MRWMRIALPLIVLSVFTAGPAGGAVDDRVTQWVDEAEVSLPRVRDILEGDGRSATIDEEGHLVVKREGMKILLRLDPKKKLVIFSVVLAFKAQITRQEKLDLANRLNDHVVFARFTVTREDLLWVDYYLSFEGGILAQQLVSSFSWFHNAVTRGISLNDSEHLVI